MHLHVIKFLEKYQSHENIFDFSFSFRVAQSYVFFQIYQEDLLSLAVVVFLWDTHLLEELMRTWRFDYEPTWEDDSPLGLCFVLVFLCFNFLDCTLVLITVSRIPLFPSVSCGVKITMRFEYPTKFKWARKAPLGSKSLTSRTWMNSHSSKYLATSFKWVTFLTCTSPNENGIYINYYLYLFSKKQDEYTYVST